MGDSHRRGDIIPGFDCSTGKAVGFTQGEWGQRIQECSISFGDGYIQVFNQDKVLIYEIYNERERSRQG